MTNNDSTDACSRNMGVAGTGVIGRAWIKVFARAGRNTFVYDREPRQANAAFQWFRDDLALDVSRGLLTKHQADEQLCRVKIRPLTSAFADVGYVQESGPERVEIKQQIMRDLDQVVESSAVIGSSTSAIDVNEFASGLPGASRIITAHPISPPYLNPALEVYPSNQVSRETLEAALALLRSVGMTPVVMNRFIYGYISARLQAALMREAINLVAKGYASVEGVDIMVREGLGQRWALFGPFGVNHTNADGGIRDYYTRYHDTYIDLMSGLFDDIPTFDAKMIADMSEQTDAMTRGASVPELRRWRDEQIALLRINKTKLPMPGVQALEEDRH